MARKDKHIMIALDEASHKYIEEASYNSKRSKTKTLKLIVSAFKHGMHTLNDGRYDEAGYHPMQLDMVRAVVGTSEAGEALEPGWVFMEDKNNAKLREEIEPSA